jgi:hypothetical protein
MKPIDHAFIGTWITDQECSDVAFTILSETMNCALSGFADRMMKRLSRWNLPSPARCVGGPGADDVRDLEEEGVKPGEMPEAWRQG